MPDTNERLDKLEEARRIIEDNLIVMAHLEARQSEMLKEHPIFLAEHNKTMKEIKNILKQQTEKGKETDDRIEKLSLAIGTFIAKPN